MDRYSGRRGATGSIAHRKGHNVGFRDATSTRDQNAQFCNRIGCNGRIKYSNQNMKVGSSDKAKCSGPSFCSSNGNKMIRNSSRSNSVMTRAKSSYLDSKRKLPSRLEFDPSESSQSGDSEAPQLMSSSGRSPVSYHSGSMNKSGEVTMANVGSSSVPSNHRSRKMFQHKSGPNKQNTQTTSVAAISKSSGLGTLNSSNRSRSLRNLKCNSISDVVRPNCSSSCSSSGSKSAGKNVMKKRSPEGDNSLSNRERQTTAAAPIDGRVSASTRGISISDSRRSSCTSGEDRNGAASARTVRSTNGNKNKMRLSYGQSGRNSSCCREPSVRISQFPDYEPTINVGRPRLSQQFSASGASSSSSSYSLSSSNDDNHSTSMSELGFSQLVNRDALQRYNMDGIAEVLLALERIEQDEEMTHEQILDLETSLFLSSLNLYDRHRDMRLDIDNMSYEELLALGERMGTVSTALSEEALLKCVERSIYQVTPSEVRFTGSVEDGDDFKCSICQEEYAAGDEIGKLVQCQHVYHVTCINQWLRLKNWCAICKTAAAPAESSSS